MFSWMCKTNKVHELEYRIRIIRALLGMDGVEEFPEDIEHRIRGLRTVEKLYIEEMNEKRLIEKSAATKKNSGKRKASSDWASRKNFKG